MRKQTDQPWSKGSVIESLFILTDDEAWTKDIEQVGVRGHKTNDGYVVTVATVSQGRGCAKYQRRVQLEHVYRSGNRDKAVGVMEYLAAYHAVIPHDDFSYTEFMKG